MTQPPAKFNLHDSRRLIAVVILVGFLVFGGLQALFAYLGLPDVLKDFLTYLSAMSLSILTYYFGVQASNDLVAQQQDTIAKQHEVIMTQAQAKSKELDLQLRQIEAAGLTMQKPITKEATQIGTS